MKPRVSNMSFLREAIHRSVDGLVVAKAHVGEGMQSLLQVGRATCPSPVWAALSRVDWKKDVQPLVNRFRAVVKKEPPTAALRAYWFGMPELLYGSTAIDVCALKKYDPNNAEGLFAGTPLVRPQFPEDGFEISTFKAALRRMENLINEDDPAAELACFVCGMGFTALLAGEVAQAIRPEQLLGPRKTCGVVAGPSGGEYHALGLITRKGWQPSPRAWLASLEPDAYLDDESDTD